MVGILVVSHGRLAEAFVTTIQFLVGGLQKIGGVSIWPRDKPKEVQEKIQQKMAEINDGDGVVILTDILGGTCTNLSLSFLKDEKVEVVTGVNVPMLLTLSSYRKGRSSAEIGKLLKRSGRRSITLVKEMVGSRGRKSRFR